MRSTFRPNRIFLAAAVWCSLALGAGGQEAKNAPPSPSPLAPLFKPGTPEEIEANVGAILDAYDLTPQPVPEIPDDPPPHEGAMIDPPEYRVEPPDLLLVELIEGLPGLPISGERLVRPDGMISLGFYGEVYVRGLTLKQVKIKILKHLRRDLTDEFLGLTEPYDGPPIPAKAPPRPRVEAPPIPDEVKEDQANLFEFGPDAPVKEVEDGAKPQEAVNAEKPQEILIQAGEGVSIRIEVGRRGEPEAKEAPKAVEAEPRQEEQPFMVPISPELSNRLFVDITAYNSKNYYVLGDVPAPGRLPHTGKDTVLDALQYAGGLSATADPNNIRLVRPGRDGKPGKVYPVDLEAIRDRGETATNYQLFPGDRLVIGRDKVVEKTIQIDRLSAPFQTVLQSLVQGAYTARALRSGFPGQEAAVLGNTVEFWIREMNRPGGVVLDETILRDALIRGLPVQPAKPEDPKGGE